MEGHDNEDGFDDDDDEEDEEDDENDEEEEEEDCHLDESGWLCTQLQISSWCLKSISLAENKIQVKGQLNTTNEILVASKIRLKHNCQSNAPKGNIYDGKGIKMVKF